MYNYEVLNFVDWCKQNYLVLNVKKTKELIFDFRKRPCIHNPLTINNDNVEQVQSYKYLGITIDDRLSFTEHAKLTKSKAHQRLFFLRKLNKFNVDNTILQLFYNSVIQSILSFNIICFYGLLSCESKKDLDRVVKTAGRICGNKASFPSTSVIFSDFVQRKTTKILKDPTHPLHLSYVFCPSGKRIRMPRSKTNRFRYSFLPHSISIYNNNATR